MPRTTKPLTDSQIQGTKKPSKGNKTLHDGNGLFIEIKANGSKLWRFRYTHPTRLDGKGQRVRVLLGFGAYPSVSLADARRKRADALELLAKGQDPQTMRERVQAAATAAAANTFEQVARQWLELKSHKVTAGYLEDVTRSLERHIFPRLGRCPVSELTARDFIDALAPIKAAGKYETIRRLCQRINEIMVYAANTGLIPMNPAGGITAAFPAPEEKNFPSLTPAKLPEFMRALATASINLQTRCLIEFQLHTMTRPSEAAGARWEEIDLEKRIWSIPAERMKKRKEHNIPLTDEVIAILETLQPISGHREHLFPGVKSPLKPMSEQTANAAIKRMSGGLFKGKLVAHGMRSIASTALNEQGFDSDVIEAALAHVDQNSVRRAYNRAEYLERRRVMMIWWSGYIVEAAGGIGSVAGSRRGLRAVG